MSSRSRFALCVILTIGMAGCGFRPLYGPSSAALAVNEDLAAIRVSVISSDRATLTGTTDRLNQQLHFALAEKLHGGRPKAVADYSLTVSTTLTSSEIGIRRDATATRARVTLGTTFALSLRAGAESLFVGRAKSIAGYDLLEANYASTIAERDAAAQATREVADQIAAELAAYFSARRSAVAQPDPAQRR